jgi:hypothetical protein
LTASLLKILTSKKSQLTTEERTAYLNAAGEAKLRKYTRRFDWESEIANIRIWTPPHCKQIAEGKHGATAYVYPASVVGIR